MKKYFYYFLSVILSWAPKIAAAASAPPIKPAGDPKVDATSLNDLVDHLGDGAINMLGKVAFYLAVIFLIWYGIQYVSSAGSPEKAKTAKAGVVNSILGIAIIAAAYSIITLGYAIANSIAYVTK